MSDLYLPDFYQTASRGAFATDWWPWISWVLTLLAISGVVALVLIKFLPGIKRIVSEYIGDPKIVKGIFFLVNSMVIVRAGILLFDLVPSPTRLYVNFLRSTFAYVSSILNLFFTFITLCVGILIVMALFKIAKGNSGTTSSSVPPSSFSSPSQEKQPAQEPVTAETVAA